MISLGLRLRIMVISLAGLDKVSERCNNVCRIVSPFYVSRLNKLLLFVVNI